MHNNNIIILELIFTTIIIILGFVFHFAFFWLRQWRPLAVFFAVNESVWEHCKIGFWPALIISIPEYFFIGNNGNNFFIAKGILLLLIPITIITTFYTYTGIIGYHKLPIDIGIFFVSVIFGKYIDYKLVSSNPLPNSYTFISIIIIIFLITIFSTFTFKPLRIPLFKDSSTKKYGILK